MRTSSTSRCAATTLIERLYATYLPAPFLSLLIDDCIATRQGLPRRRRALQHQLYPGRRPGHDHRQPVGDQIPCLRDSRPSAWDELLARCRPTSPGTSALRQMLLNRTPRYGNDDDRADRVMRASSRPTSTPSTGGPTRAAGSTTSTCCRPPATSTLAR
jgi:pyruvate-formate lyase